MIQPLNYTTKAIGSLLGHKLPGAPDSRAGVRYLAAKLRQAQVFLLSDHGELLDREKPRPEVPGLMFRPPFPIVALEYTANAERRTDPYYTAARSSRRISLAWNWQNDLPRELAGLSPKVGPGVAIASIYYSDEHRIWLPVPALMHLEYEEPWQPITKEKSPFATAMLANGSISKAAFAGRSQALTPIAIMPEALEAMAIQVGVDATLDSLVADSHDEVNAYSDLCMALACNNVATERHIHPDRLNKSRIRNGKLPLKDFHVLKLAGASAMPGSAAGGDRSGPRSHLRRGHIRRLTGERVTWVNSTIVRGRGFVDKVYAA